MPISSRRACYPRPGSYYAQVADMASLPASRTKAAGSVRPAALWVAAQFGGLQALGSKVTTRATPRLYRTSRLDDPAESMPRRGSPCNQPVLADAERPANETAAVKRNSLFRKYFLALFIAVLVPLLANGVSEAWLGYRDQRAMVEALLRAEADWAAGRSMDFSAASSTSSAG